MARILWVGKNWGAGLDVLKGEGRQFHLPHELSRRGHEVQTCLFSLYDRFFVDKRKDGLTLHIYPMRHPRLLRAGSELRKLANRFRPDVVVGAGDIPFVLMAQKIARVLNRPLVLDIWDNFAAYPSARIPFVLSLFHSALGQAELVLVPNSRLQQKLANEGARRVRCVTNGVDPKIFFPRTEKPRSARFSFGYAGAISRTRRIESIFEAWRRVEKSLPEADFFLVGPRDRRLAIPKIPRLHDLGRKSQTEVANLLRTWDVAVVQLVPNPFGYYSCPLKAVEAWGCQTPTLLPRCAEWPAVFDDDSRWLFDSESPRDLARALEDAVARPSFPKVTANTWQALAEIFDREMSEVI